MEKPLTDSSAERVEIDDHPIDEQSQSRNTVANGLSTDAEEEERARERASKREICFVRESVLRRLNRLPRRGSDQSFRDPVTGLPNDNVHEPLEKFDGSKTCFVFISHLRLRPGADPVQGGARGAEET